MGYDAYTRQLVFEPSVLLKDGFRLDKRLILERHLLKHVACGLQNNNLWRFSARFVAATMLNTPTEDMPTNAELTPNHRGWLEGYASRLAALRQRGDALPCQLSR